MATESTTTASSPSSHSSEESHFSSQLSGNPLAFDPMDLQILSSNADFMSFFFQHVASCPPRGPFRYYSALSFVTRARERYAPFPKDHHHSILSSVSKVSDDTPDSYSKNTPCTSGECLLFSSSSMEHTEENSLVSSSNTTVPLTATAVGPNLRNNNSTTSSSGASRAGTSSGERLFKAIHVHSILALMDLKFSTTHLSSWPLFYVLSGVNSSDVKKIIAQQQQSEVVKEQSEVSSPNTSLL